MSAKEKDAIRVDKNKNGCLTLIGFMFIIIIFGAILDKIPSTTAPVDSSTVKALQAQGFSASDARQMEKPIQDFCRAAGGKGC